MAETRPSRRPLEPVVEPAPGAQRAAVAPRAPRAAPDPQALGAALGILTLLSIGGIVVGLLASMDGLVSVLIWFFDATVTVLLLVVLHQLARHVEHQRAQRG